MRLIIAALSFVSFSVYAAPDLTKKVSLTAKKISVVEAMKQLSENSGVEIVVDRNVKWAKPISLDLQEATLKDVLDFFAVETGAQWEPGTGNSVKFTTVQ